VCVYVDDLIITGMIKKKVEAFKGEMQWLFHMSDLGLLSYYLRTKVKQHQEAATLGQAAYAQKLLKKAGMQDCNSCQAPMEVRLKMTKASSTPMVDSTMWRSLVGSLWYLVHT